MNCPWCGRELPANMEGAVIDHIIPRARGGPNDRWNKQLLHTRCNIEKGDKMTPAAEALARVHGVALREPAGRDRIARQRLLKDSDWLQLQVAIKDVQRHMKFTIDATSPVPDYRQLADQLREKIQNGTIPDSLPRHKDLAAASGLSMSTVQHAIRVLKEEGVVYSASARARVRHRP